MMRLIYYNGVFSHMPLRKIYLLMTLMKMIGVI